MPQIYIIFLKQPNYLEVKSDEDPVYCTNKLSTMFDHLFHRAILQACSWTSQAPKPSGFSLLRELG